MKNIQISQKHYDLLVKIYEGAHNKEDLKNYFNELYSENLFNDKDLPKLSFDEKKTTSEFGYYFEGAVTLCERLLQKIVNNKNEIVDGINTLGHEYRHYMHDKIDTNDVSMEDVKKHLLRMKRASDVGVYFNELQTYAFNLLRNKKDWEVVDNLLSKYFKNTKFQSWYKKLDEKEKIDLKDVMKQSRYFSSQHEYDARVAGIVYTSLVLSIYKHDEKIMANRGLFNWIEELSKTTQNMTEAELDEYGDNGYMNMQEDFDLCIAESNVYQAFAKAIKADFKHDIIKNFDSAYRGSKPNKQKIKLLDALANIAFGEYIEHSVKNYDLINSMLHSAFDGAFGENSTFESKKIGHKIIQNYFVIATEESAKHVARKLTSNYNEHYKTYKFSQDDDFLLYMASQKESYNTFSFTQNILRKLNRDLRYSELYQMVDFVDVYNKTEEETQSTNDFLYSMDKFMRIKVDAIKRSSEWLVSKLSTYDASEKEFDDYLKVLQKLKFEYGFRKIIGEQKNLDNPSKLVDENWGITEKQIDKLISETEKKKNQKFPKSQMGE